MTGTHSLTAKAFPQESYLRPDAAFRETCKLAFKEFSLVVGRAPTQSLYRSARSMRATLLSLSGEPQRATRPRPGPICGQSTFL